MVAYVLPNAQRGAQVYVDTQCPGVVVLADLERRQQARPLVTLWQHSY